MIIEQMELGYMESDRPATISSKTLSSTDNALKQKGKMVSLFFQTLPIRYLLTFIWINVIIRL